MKSLLLFGGNISTQLEQQICGFYHNQIVLNNLWEIRLNQTKHILSGNQHTDRLYMVNLIY